MTDDWGGASWLNVLLLGWLTLVAVGALLASVPDVDAHSWCRRDDLGGAAGCVRMGREWQPVAHSCAESTYLDGNAAYATDIVLTNCTREAGVWYSDEFGGGDW